jgi:AcrR family transcriptional regulator
MSKKDNTESKILDAAYQLFVERGYQGSSMRDIAERAGIKAGSIYNHYSGKEAIFQAVFIERHPLFRILSILDEVKGSTAELLLTNATNRLHKELQEEPGLLNLFFVELVEMDGKHIPQAIRTNFPADSNFMKQIFSMKKELRDIREPVLIRALIGTFFANMMFGWFVGDTNSRRWGSLKEMTDVFLNGVIKH